MATGGGPAAATIVRMESVQTMRWILVNATGVAGIIAIALGYVLPGIVLLFGVSLHFGHWWVTRNDPPADAAPADRA